MTRRILVGTYNMSFASDYGWNPVKNTDKGFISEGNFLLRLKDNPEPRTFWLNALSRLCDFLRKDDAAFVGLQELNKAEPGSGTGSDAIQQKVTDINKTTNRNYSFVAEEWIVSPFVKPGIGIIWDKDVFGDEVAHELVDLEFVNDDNNDGTVFNKAGQKGRPMLMLLTTKGYLLISTHSPNYSQAYTDTFTTFQKVINDYIVRFLNNNEKVGTRVMSILDDNLKTRFTKIDPAKILIAGDFNDRYDGLRKFKIESRITITDKDVDLTYKGQSARSCCYNWDSSCSKPPSNAIKTLGKNSRFIQKVFKRGDTIIGDCDSENYRLAGAETRPGINGVGKINLEHATMNDEGKIKNYVYYSDKIFGLNPGITINDRTLSMYPNEDINRLNDASIHSDHEMVYGTFLIPGDDTTLEENYFAANSNIRPDSHINMNVGGRRRRTKKAGKAKKTLKYKKKGSKKQSKRRSKK